MLVADRPALGLLTDLYQLTMAAGYLRSDKADDEAVFHLFFRRNPFGGGYAVACGLEQVTELLTAFRYTPEDTSYLAGLEGNDGRPLFAPEFLEYLRNLELSVDVDAMPEGTVVFPHEPLLRVRGPLAQCQLLETALLTILNFQTLIATKASRVVAAAGGDPVLEFGLRRAQGVDGGLSASRAAFIGGCVATSNVMAGRRYGIPVRGTHAHSWVMSFDDEPEAFSAWAEASPNNCVFLVDTYDSLEGIDNAIRSACDLRERGFEPVGIRLDSGDFVELSREARRRLDAAGFPDASVVASNNLDEHRITRLKVAGAQVDVWGVGTRLATAYDQPALGGVYKLTAVRGRGASWSHKLKLSEDRIKISIPGVQQVRRFRSDSGFLADVIYDLDRGISEPCEWLDPSGNASRIPEGATSEDLLTAVTRRGRLVRDLPTAADIQRHASAQLESLAPAVRRLDEPAVHPVGLDIELHRLRERLIGEVRT
ncbi:MAG: nicotinate phosphoribosyltransferase [bacterium]|nr:nicotinate phosphoribosyltransferase [bacterium]